MSRIKLSRVLMIVVLSAAVSLAGNMRVNSQQASVTIISATPPSWTGVEIWVSRISDPATASNQCDRVFTSGESIHVYFRVQTPTVWVKIWDFDSDQGKVLLFDEQHGVPQRVAAGQVVRALSGTIQGSGWETLVLQTRLNDGSWITSFCSMHVRETASFREDFEFGNTLGLSWRHGRHIPWFVTNSSWRPGQQYAAQAGPIGHSQRSILEIAFFTNQLGTLSFWYRVSSESCCDFLRFYINRNEVQRWAGEKGWAQASFYLPAGLHTLRWEYTKDSSDSRGQDTAWLDDISFMPSW